MVAVADDRLAHRAARVLSVLGDRVDKGRVPVPARDAPRRPASRALWGGVLDRVLRRPRSSSLAAGGLLVALALPALGMHTGQPGIRRSRTTCP